MNDPIKHFRIIGDDRGSLIALENGKDIQFDIKRIYYIFGTKSGVVRGLHAHKELEQFLICTSGSCKILLDNGKGKKDIYELDSPDKGLYVGPGSWREMYDFSPDAVLMVIASHIYDEADYIRNYDEFVEYMNK
jgi:dTDP-4-dehydrorhamnose 3,5-epimerase-like enzyme